jgi:hypothetical protein
MGESGFSHIKVGESGFSHTERVPNSVKKGEEQPTEIGRCSLTMKPLSTPEEFLTNLSETILSSQRTPLAIRALIKLRKQWAGMPQKAPKLRTRCQM